METNKDWDIPDEYLVEIGRVIVRWSKLEGLLELCLIELLGKDITESRSLVVFTHMSFPQKMDVLGALVSEIIMNPSIAWLKRYRPEVEPLLRDAQTRRNEIAHAKWGMDSRGKVGKSSIKAHGSLKLHSSQASIAELERASKSIAIAADALAELVFRQGRGSAAPHNGQ